VAVVTTEGSGRVQRAAGRERLAGADPVAGPARLVALRGATTVERDNREALIERTSELLTALLDRNSIEHDQLVSIIFTATEDLASEFPAAAARAIGLGDVPLLCARELSIEGGNPATVRVLIHCYSTRSRASLRHVYLHRAKHLRDDLPE
jgi:chorismate mutase